METTQKNRENGQPRREAPKGEARRPQKAASQREEPSRRPPRQEAARDSQKRPQEERASAGRPNRQETAVGQKRPPEAQQRAAKPGAQREAGEAPRQRSGQAQPKTGQKRPNPNQKQPKQSREAPKSRPSGKQKGLSDSVSNKKRAYGNSKPKKRSRLSILSGMIRDTARKNAEKKKSREAKGKTGRTKRPQQPTPAVIYTQPQAFNRSRFLVQLLTVTAVVMALVLGLSVFFKVERITVSGAGVYSAWTVREASGITEGDNLLTFSRARAGAQIKANLPYVKDVRFGIKLPDTVNIIIVEENVVYAIKDANGQWWLMNSDGRVVEQCSNGKASNYTQILGVTLDNPVADQKGTATENAPTATDESGELIPLTVTGAQRLATALEILKALENNDIVGDAASVNVARLEDIVLWYGTRYQVNLGDSARLDYKINCMNDVILQLNEYQSGILDISFSIRPNEVIYTPFS